MTGTALVEQKHTVSYDFLEICCDITAALGKVCDDQVSQYKCWQCFCLLIGCCSTSCKILDAQSKELSMQSCQHTSSYFLVLLHIVCCYAHLLRFISNQTVNSLWMTPCLHRCLDNSIKQSCFLSSPFTWVMQILHSAFQIT